MSAVLIVGIVINAIALPIVARRVAYLYRVITAGQPAPEWQGVCWREYGWVQVAGSVPVKNPSLS